MAAGPSKLDLLLLSTGLIAAIGSGVPFPLIGILFGQVIDDLNSSTCDTPSQSGDGASYQRDVNQKVLLVVYLAIAQFAMVYLHMACWSLAGARLAQRVRDRYLQNLLRQEVSFFDNLPAGEVSFRLSGDIQTVRAGTSEKVGICISSVSFFITAYVVAFLKEPKLAGMLVSLVPAYFLMSFVGSFFIEKYSARLSEYAAASSTLALEALSNIPIVHTFNALPRLELRFESDVHRARVDGIKKAFATGVQSGFMYFIAYAANSLAFWQGSRTIADTVEESMGNASVGRTYTVIFILVDGE